MLYVYVLLLLCFSVAGQDRYKAW